MHNTEELRVILRMVADTTGARQTQQALQQTQQQARQAQQSLVPAGIAGGLAARIPDALGKITEAYTASIDAAREHERVTRTTALAYGAAASQYQRFATSLSATTGFTSDAILEAALSARTLSQNYGLTIQQTQKLISVSADLARVRGIGIAEAFERVQSAIRGEAEASEYLGLTLNDTYLTNQAMNGSLKNTFGTMTDGEKAQVRYTELLKQAAQFSGLASKNADTLDASFGRLSNSVHNLQIEIGKLATPATIWALDKLAGAVNLVAEGGVLGRAGFWRFLQNLPGHTFQEAAAIAFPNVTKISDDLADIKDRAPGAAAGLYDVAAAAKRIKEASEAAVRPGVTVISNTLADLKESRDSVGRASLAAAQEAARLQRQAAEDQLGAATRDLVLAQYRQTELQRESVNLAAEEARIRLSMLPAQQQMAELQRQMTEQQIRARMAALPATEHLEDLQYEEQRARLLLQQPRGAVSIEERIAARRRIMELGRGEMAEAELAALEAGRGVTLAERAGTRVGLQGQLLDIASQRALSDISGAITSNSLAQAIGAAVVQAQQAVVQQILDANRGQPLRVNINVTLPNGSVVSYDELVDASNQSQLPPPIQSSAVRRSGPS